MFVGCLEIAELIQMKHLEPIGTDENSDSSYESLKDEIKMAANRAAANKEIDGKKRHSQMI